MSLLKDLQSHLVSTPLNLIEPIRAKYPTSNTLPHSTNTGSYPIGGIFVSPELSNITRGEWLELGEDFSDHRILFFDIDMFQLLGRHKNFTAVRTIRRLQCNDPRTVHAYNSILERQYQFHNDANKLAGLDATIKDMPTSQQLVALNKLDRINTQLIKHAERRCRKLRMGAHPFTPQTAKLGLSIEFWRALIRKLEGPNIS